jgi:glycosyltransferase involved in cell wall biosynthesis
MKPVALVTGTVSDYRREPFRLLSEAEPGGVEVLDWDGKDQRAIYRRIASGRYRAVIGGIGGRVALPAAYAGARRARVPFVLWASLWAHPRSAAHALSYLPLRAIYRGADAVATYGPHVSRYVETMRSSGDVFVATQAVDQEHYGRAVGDDECAAARERLGGGDFVLLFAGRLVREKGVDVLLEAWRRAGVDGTLAFAGSGPIEVPNGIGQVGRDDLPALYAAADALVLPSLQTATFKEPWGLVVNEAMHQGTPVITSDAVGAAAGGLVVDGRNGHIVPAGDADALATRIRALAANPRTRARLGAAARDDAAPYTFRSWQRGMSAALQAASGRRGLC